MSHVKTETTVYARDAHSRDRRLGEEEREEEVLFTLTADQAVHLSRTIGMALVSSLKVRPGFRERA